MPKISDPYTELASMFLTGGEKPAPAAPTSSPSARNDRASSATIQKLQIAPIELLIVGHLPVRGNLWLPPYVDAVAQNHGAAALVRLDGPEPSVQLLRASTEAANQRVGGTMNDAIADLGGFVDQWIIRLPTGVRIEDLAPPAQRVDRITILTSADEAAVVAAYQIIKQLAQAAETAPLPSVGLAVVGADAKIAAEMVDRLNRTTISFLGIELHLSVCLPRIDAGLKSTRYVSFAGHTEISLDDAIGCVTQARTRREPEIAEPADVAGRLYTEREEATVTRAETVLRHAPVPPKPSVAAAALHQPAPPAQSTPIHTVTPTWIDQPIAPAVNGAPSRTPVIKLAPKPAMVVEAKQPSRTVEPDDHGTPRSLASFVEGLTPLPVRSPGHEKIEIAVDADGHLHLLGHEQSLREMPVVERWTTAHRELIIMACPQRPIDSLASPRCHIFADRPIALADLHGSDLCLHVLTPVQVNGQTAWYSAPLNATV